MDDDKLKPKHEQFCLEYLKNGNNATQAYKAVYGTKKDRTAESNANRLLRNAEVQAFLKQKQEKISNKKQKEYEIDINWVVNQYKKTILDCYKFQNMAEQKEDIRAGAGIIKVKIEALDKIAHYLGIKPNEELYETIADHELIYKEKIDTKLNKAKKQVG